MSTPSFIDRLRSRSRRPASGMLDGAPLPLLETSPGPLPEDHWHAGDPRLAPGEVALVASEVPAPRRPADRRRLSVVSGAASEDLPEVDLRADVVDLRGASAPAASGAGTPSRSTHEDHQPPAQRTAPSPPPPKGPAGHLGCDEPSTWLG